METPDSCDQLKADMKAFREEVLAGHEMICDMAEAALKKNGLIEIIAVYTALLPVYAEATAKAGAYLDLKQRLSPSLERLKAKVNEARSRRQSLN
ncbi:MAG: hypothetical protein RBU21_14620 [FCB group bacterium]|jgi:hypothetical protein|nr:hypothetical protein [FCB group bacterium]